MRARGWAGEERDGGWGEAGLCGRADGAPVEGGGHVRCPCRCAVHAMTTHALAPTRYSGRSSWEWPQDSTPWPLEPVMVERLQSGAQVTSVGRGSRWVWSIIRALKAESSLQREAEGKFRKVKSLRRNQCDLAGLKATGGAQN